MNPTTLSRYLLLLAIAFLVWPVASSAVSHRQSNNRVTSQQQPAPSGNQQTGSILIYNFYKTDIKSAGTDTEISLTNTDQNRSVGVHFYFVSQSSCSVKETYFGLAGNQTITFPVSNFAQNDSGYILAVAVDFETGAPTSHNFLTGSEYIKTTTGHGGKVSAVAVNALFEGTLPGVGRGAETATLNFDGSAKGYSQIPRALTIDNLTSPADSNDTIVVVNRISGNLTGKAASLGTLSGAVSNGAGAKFPFSTKVNSCQMQSPLTELLPNVRTAISAKQTAKMNISSDTEGDNGLVGITLTANSRNAALADARNFNSSTLSAKNSLVIPINVPIAAPTAGANLEMAMTANPPLSVVRGSNITYTLTSTNRGPDAAFNVIIRDTVPTNATFVSATPSAGGSCTMPPVGGPGTVICTFSGSTGLLVARTLTLVVQVSEEAPAGSEIVNTGTTSSSTSDPNPSNNSRTIRTTVTSTADELLIATNSLAIGKTGVPYSSTLVAINGIDPLTWSIVGGGMPNGVFLNPNGTFAGTPTVTGIFPIRVRVLDGDFRIAEKNLTLRIVSQFATAKSDFDGDGRTDLAVWRGSTGQWFVNRSTNGSLQTVTWGAGYDPYFDIPVAADYDGDGKADFAVWRPLDGVWYIINSGDGSVRVEGLGQNGDIPVPGDYDGDGQTDLAAWNGSTGLWLYRQSSDGIVKEVAWGSGNDPYFDVPVPADYDGDGKTDFAVWRGNTGIWYILRSSDGGVQQELWGSSDDPFFDVPVQGDYDGDGKADVAVWRGGTGDWFVLRSSNSSFFSVNWGAGYDPYFDIPVPGDYDGDGKVDIAVWRSSTGDWFIIRSGDGGVTIQGLGQNGDTPIPR